MVLKRALNRFRRGTNETPPKIDAVLKEELDEAIINLRRFTEQIRSDMDYIENLDNQHKIPEEMLKEED